MARKWYRTEEIIAKLREVGVLSVQRMEVAGVIEKPRIHEVVYYRYVRKRQ